MMIFLKFVDLIGQKLSGGMQVYLQQSQFGFLY